MRGCKQCGSYATNPGRHGRPYRVFVAVLKDKIPQQEEVNTIL